MFPSAPGDFNMKAALANASVQVRFTTDIMYVCMCLYVIDFVSIQARLKRFVGDRGTGAQEVYGAQLQAAHHIHVPGDDNYRILQHHYGRSVGRPDLSSHS